VADERTLYLLATTGDAAAGTLYECHFGDLYSMADSDPYAVLLIGATSENQSNTRHFSRVEGDASTLTSGHYMPRSYTALGTAIQVGKHSDYAKNTSNQMGSSTALAYLNGPDGKLYTAPIWVYESGRHIRGRMRGVRDFLHDAVNLAHKDTFSGIGTLSGKTFLFVKTLSTPGGGCVFETSDGWETN